MKRLTLSKKALIIKIKNYTIDILGIAFGSMLSGFAFSMFLIPFKSAPGGVGGLSQILYYLFKLPAGISMLIFNIPLFILGIIFLGRTFGIKTLIGMLFVSFFTDLFSYKNLIKISSLKPFLYQISDRAYSFTNEYFLGVLAGSLLLGIGLGIVFKFNGSTGGTDIPALIFKKYLGISPGTSFLMMDTIIIFSVGIIFKNGNLILWGLLSLFISSKVVDYFVEGFPYNKGIIVMSDKSDEIKKFILENLDRGCTVFYGEGGYTKKQKNIVYTVINRRELIKLQHYLKEIDKNSFIIVNDVYDVLGNGFKKF